LTVNYGELWNEMEISLLPLTAWHIIYVSTSLQVHCWFTYSAGTVVVYIWNENKMC